MATIVEMINPLTGLPEQVDKLDHTAQEIDDAVDLAPQLSNPNLLDNWYFGNPVNQRGQTSYTAAGYGIDRWRIGSEGTLTIQDGYITFASSDATLRNLEQALETLEVGKYTISLLAENAAGTNLIIGLVSGFTSATISTNEKQVVSLTFDVTTKTSGTVYIQTGNSQIKLYAAKLELGSQQTLAHKDADGNWVLNEIPDYGEQLRRCQRYFVNFNPYKMSYFAMPPAVASNASQAYSAVTLPVAMRAQPVVSYGGNIALSQNADHAITAILASDNTFTGNSIQLRYDVSAGTLTANSLYRVQGSNDPTSYIWLSADL